MNDSSDASQPNLESNPKGNSHFIRAGQGRTNNNKIKKRVPREEKLDEKEYGLINQIYDLGYNQADNFENTTREIAEYVGHEYLNG